MSAKYPEDTFFRGRIRVRQDRKGYRFSIDAVLLAAHACPRPGERILDLGTGCGIIPLMLAGRYPEITVTGVEIQPELASMATENAALNHMGDRVRIIHGDMKALTVADIDGPMDFILSNPPYRKADSGRINPNHQRAAARHEIHITLDALSAVASRLLRIGGRFMLIYPVERLADLVTAMRSRDMEPKHIRVIHTGVETEARLILMEGVRGGKPGLRVDRPLFIYRGDGEYTDEVEAMFNP